MTWTLLGLALIVVWAATLWAWPTAWIHPVLTWHRLVLRHTWDVVPEGFADWEIVCSCGKKAYL